MFDQVVKHAQAASAAATAQTAQTRNNVKASEMTPAEVVAKLQVFFFKDTILAVRTFMCLLVSECEYVYC